MSTKNSVMSFCILISIFALFVDTVNATLKDGLVAFWSFDNCDATDDSGNGHDGIVNENPACVDGAHGKAFNFTGSMPENIRVNNFPEITESLSVMAWVKTIAPGAPSGNPVVTKGFSTGPYTLWVAGNEIVLSLNWGFDSLGDCRALANANDNEFHYIAGVYDYDANKIKMFLDGNKISECSYFEPIQSNFEPLYISSDYPGGHEHFIGIIDNVLVYNRALSESEVQDIYNNGGPIAVTAGMPDDTMAPTGAVHAHDNMIWSPNNKMVTVNLDGYVVDELSIARDGGGIGVASAYLLVDGTKIILRDETTDLLREDGSFSVKVEIKAVKGVVYSADLYATDTKPGEAGGPNSGLVDSTYIRVPHDMSGGK